MIKITPASATRCDTTLSSTMTAHETLPWPSEAESRAVEQTLAKFKRDPNRIFAQGRVVAYNGSFTCYALANGLIRVIHRATEAMLLLRGLTADVTDMCFCDSLDLLGAISADGHVYTHAVVQGDLVGAAGSADRMRESAEQGTLSLPWSFGEGAGLKVGLVNLDATTGELLRFTPLKAEGSGVAPPFLRYLD